MVRATRGADSRQSSKHSEKFHSPSKLARLQPQPKQLPAKQHSAQDPLLRIQQPTSTVDWNNPLTAKPITPPHMAGEDDEIDFIVHAEGSLLPARSHSSQEQSSQINANDHASTASPIGYRCRICHLVHDTKDQAKQCFAGHFDAQGRQISGTDDIDLQIDS